MCVKRYRYVAKGEGTLKTLNTLLTMKQQEINQQVKQQQAVLNKIKNVQYYVNEASTSPITHLKDIEHVMSKSAEMKSIRRNIWISAGIIGIIQYSSIMSSILMKNKWPFLIVLPFMIGYGIGVTFITNKRLPIYVPTASIYSHHLCGQLSKRKHTATTRRFECPNCHETHYCIEVPKAHMSTEQLEVPRTKNNN